MQIRDFCVTKGGKKACGRKKTAKTLYTGEFL
nr:MAG TPA: hypothetical protein [Caudoviricetes sp.]